MGTFKVNAYCKQSRVDKEGKAQIEISIIVDGKRVTIGLPKKVKPADFQSAMKGRETTDLKKYVNKVLSDIDTIHTRLSLQDEVITAYRIKDIYLNGEKKNSYTLDDLKTDFLSLKVQENVEPLTCRKYEVVFDEFLNFTGHKGSDELTSVSNADIVKYISKVKQIFKQTTSGRKQKLLKSYFIYAVNNGHLKLNPFLSIKIHIVEEERPFLTYDEVKDLEVLNLTNYSLERARDMFLFQCYTGLAYVDAKNLRPGDIKKNAYGNYYIKKKRIKTGVEYTTILFEKASEIFEVYGLPLPFTSDVKYNLALKKIAQLAGIEKNLTSHMGRHTFCCYCLNIRELPLEIVQKLAGHKSIRETQHYAKMTDNTVFEKTRDTDDFNLFESIRTMVAEEKRSGHSN